MASQSYAEVLYSAISNKEDCAYDLNVLNETFMSSDYEFFNSYVIEKNEKKKVLKEITGLNEEVRNFLYTLVDNNEFKNFTQIIKEFNTIFLNEKNIIIVNIEVAKNLTNSLRKEVIDNLETKLNAFVVLKENINPVIIGGIKIQYKDYLIDNSIVTYLNNLEKEIRKEVL